MDKQTLLNHLIKRLEIAKEQVRRLSDEHGLKNQQNLNSLNYWRGKEAQCLELISFFETLIGDDHG